MTSHENALGGWDNDENIVLRNKVKRRGERKIAANGSRG
jgi:hypothetical protein